MAGFVPKSLASLVSTVANWWQGDDGSVMPAHAAMLVDVNGTAIGISPNPSSTYKRQNSSASETGLTIKATAGYLYGVTGYNNSASVRYLRFMNRNAAATSVDIGVMILRLPPSSVFNFTWPAGYYFSSAIAFGLTTDNGSTSSSSVSAADIQDLNFFYA
ncbi:hypothetical protein EYW49_22005 [Siculibacillus lacustris]|uniref:Uncharacterized protein n=1 Tax=Siculibacillus lacustris TaxID=1549641 RepID=A0A4Q9VEJ9_9HYPH|nr:hypothetical protein [Siculibacillus lacustris]TBW32615.1 hypothetical protein EYW49_22005 [Siculibacillus lacustris]